MPVTALPTEALPASPAASPAASCTKPRPAARHCPVEATIDIVGGKHKVLVLWHLTTRGTLRFGELRRLVPQATPKMLTQQLRELEADGMVRRTLYREVPPRTEYTLTDRGRSFEPVLRAMCDWGTAVLAQTGGTACSAPRRRCAGGAG